MKSRRVTLAILALFALLAGGVVAWLAVREHPAVQAVHKAAETVSQAVGEDVDVDVDLTLRSIELSHAEDGQLRWKMRAENARYVQDEQAVEVDDPRIEYYTRKLGGNATDLLIVTALQARVEQENETAVLTGDVQAVTSSGVVTAQRLEYLGKNRELVLTGDVAFTGEFNCTAPVFWLNLDTRDVMAKGGPDAMVEAWLLTPARRAGPL